MKHHRFLWTLVAGLVALLAVNVMPASAFTAINPSQSSTTVTLTGKDITIDQVVAVARFGAKVQLSPEARQRSLDAYNLLLEGARQNIPIYFFNRGTGSQRETIIFEGDALTPANRQLLLDRQLAVFKNGARGGIGPEVADEDIVRAMMVVRANTMVYEAATPELTQMLIDLLNKQVTPVVQSRGSPGEGDLPQMGNVAGTMAGVGDAYYKGKRMHASKALDRAGLDPLVPFAADQAALVSTNAFSAGQAALLLYEARRMLDWADLTYAMNMLGLNSSITPLTAVPQSLRPYPYQNKQARRLLNLIRGSYLFEFEQGDDRLRRIIQDPLSFRDYSQRNGALWEAYDRLKKNILIQINSSDHNPAVLPGSRPSDSWELDTPWLRRYFIQPGPYSSKGGFILSNANFVAQPWGTDVEAFTIAVGESVAGSVQRVLRLTDAFFTVVTTVDVLPANVRALAPPLGASYTISDLMAEIQVLSNPMPAQGLSLVSNVEDMETYTRQRTERARKAVDNAMLLIGQELLSASYWMELRKAQKPDRSFGQAPAAALAALRKVIPWQLDPNARPEKPAGEIVYEFMLANPAGSFMGADAAEPTLVTATYAQALAEHLVLASSSASRAFARA